MANHCIYHRCTQCGHDYCIRCNSAFCTNCGTGFYDKETLTFETMTENRAKQIIEDAMALPLAERKRLLFMLQEVHPEEEKLKPSLGREAFCDFFYEKYGTQYYWSVKDYTALSQLLNKIKKKHVERGADFDNKVVLDGFKLYLKKVYALKNEFYNANFTMSILNSKFNEIYIAISGKKQGKISNDYKSRILRDLQS